MRKLILIHRGVNYGDPPVTLRVVTDSGARGLLPFGGVLTLSVPEEGGKVIFSSTDDWKIARPIEEYIPKGPQPVVIKVWVFLMKKELPPFCLASPLSEEEAARLLAAPAGVPRSCGELARYWPGGERWMDPHLHRSGLRGEQLYSLATIPASLVLALLTLPGSDARQKMKKRGCHTLEVKMAFHFEDVEFVYYFDGSKEPGAFCRQSYQYMVCGTQGRPFRLDDWERDWVEDAAHTHLVRLLAERCLWEKAYMEDGRIGLCP